jgi:LysR family carnitine catabolism transcriptional activator
MNISFRQLELFLALARTLSFSLAAKECNVSQSALSASIKKLEILLGATLFDRHTRKVTLTAVGQEFLSLGKLLNENMQNSQTRIREFIDGKRGKLVIAAVPSIAASYGPRMVAKFATLYPHIEVRLIDALSDQCLNMIRMGSADVALAPGLLGITEFQERKLFEDELVAVFPEKHALAHKPILSWVDVSPHPQVAVNATGHLRQTIEESFRRHGVIFQPAFEVAQVGTMLGLIREGLGIGVLSKTFMDSFDLQKLSFRPIDSPSAYRTICCITASKKAHSPAVDAFIASCLEL